MPDMAELAQAAASHRDPDPDDADAILSELELDLWAVAAAGRVRALRSATDLTRITAADVTAPTEGSNP